MLGMNYVLTNGAYVVNMVDTFMFEYTAAPVTFLLLKYYLTQSDNRKRNDKYFYMHNTLYLR
jgi:sulfur relay (sulfurtransferase) DsrC/TusE family protein